MRSLQSFQPPAPVAAAKPKPPMRKIMEQSKVVLTQGILYRTLGGADQLVRPGHKMIPPGTVGTVTKVIDDGQFQVEFRAPVAGVLALHAPEIKIWEKA